MICEKCKKNKATVKIVKIVGDQKIEESLCVNCAFGVESKNQNSIKKSFDINKFMGSLLNSADINVDGILHSKIVEENNEKKCDLCGTTYDEIKNFGLIGCGKCYKVFKQEIEEKIRSYQGMSQMRKRKKYNFISENEKNIDDLEYELKEAIKYEEYEKAVVIRDCIKELESRRKEDEQ